jgi:predicted nucleic acid-binding protein
MNRLHNNLSNLSTSSISQSLDKNVLKIFEETVTSLCLSDKCCLLMTDARSMLSDLDREYLSHALAMMTLNETRAIQDEVIFEKYFTYHLRFSYPCFLGEEY